MSKNLRYQPVVQLVKLSPITCNLCQFVTFEKELLKRHVAMSHSEADFEESVGRVDYEDAKTDDTRKQTFDCGLCNFSTKYSKCLENHRGKEHSEEIAKSIESEEFVEKYQKRANSISSIELDSAIDRPSKRQKCSRENSASRPKKPKSGDMKSKENVSMKTHHPPEPDTPLLVCSICHLLFDKQVNLMTHMEITHLKAFEFQCCVCSLTFGRRTILSLHLRTVHSMDAVTAEEIIDEQQNEQGFNGANLGNYDVENDVTYIENKPSTSDDGTFDPLKAYHANEFSPIKIKLHSGDIKQNGSSTHSKQRLKRSSLSKSNLVEELSNGSDDNLSNKNNSDDDNDSNYDNYVETVMSDENDDRESDSTKKNIVAKSIKKKPRKSGTRDKDTKKVVCPICEVKLDEKKLSRHLGSIHTVEEFQTCNLCHEICFSRNLLRSHLAKIHDIKKSDPIVCDICGKKFTTRTNLKNHRINIHENSDPTLWKFSCTECPKKYSNEKLLRDHFHLSHDKKSSAPCPVCEKLFTSRQLKSHLSLVHTAETSHQCDQCNAILSNRKSLKVHKIRLHKRTVRPLCPQCGKDYCDKRQLMLHIKLVHEKNLEYICEQCGKNFDCNGRLKAHVEKTHLKIEKEPPTHLCDQCQFAADSKKKLIIHKVEIHGLEKEHLCSYCPKSFATNSQLLSHVNSVHKNTNVNCEECGRHFNKLTSMQRHIKTVHNMEKPHKCPVCGQAFGVKTSMQRHMKGVHKVVW